LTLKIEIKNYEKISANIDTSSPAPMGAA